MKTMERVRSSLAGWSLLLSVSLLAGCMVPQEPTDGGWVSWTGTSTAGLTPVEGQSCAPLSLEVFVMGSVIRGTATTVRQPDTPDTVATPSFRIDGNVLGEIDFVLTLREYSAWPPSPARAETVWRGPVGEGTVVAREQPPGCERTVTLVRGAS